MKKDYSQSAEKLVIALGGKSNVTRMFHCMTRLRFYVKNRKLVNEADIKTMPTRASAPALWTPSPAA